MEDELGRNEQWKNKHNSLVVGRGAGQTWWTDSPSSLVCDRFGGVFKEDHPHLWMDFNNLNALRYLQSNVFKEIIIDWSTWRYMFHSTDVLTEWHRVLDTNGRLVFEGGLSSFKIVPEHQLNYPSFNGWYYEHDNFSHAVFTTAMIQKYIPDFPIKMNQRIIIPAESPKNKITEERKYWNQLRLVSLVDLNAAYKSFFEMYGWKVEFEPGFPIRVSGVIRSCIVLKKV
ncbi:hypothetical protein HDV04_002044 [Boothiomyces sp. JEL0838]|nr:hypothetical protein HDV04_002044 [Boothiomyces sp. JEL0838]